MSVLIKGMKMPKNCEDCKISVPIGLLGVGVIQHCPLFQRVADEDECPLIELPPHGRLIDADALIIDLLDRGIEGLQTDDFHEIQQAVADAPTILEAEVDDG